MPGLRTYGDRCGVARALDLVGERWALLIVRELLLGPKRFTDLRRGLPAVSPDVLAQRLRELEDAGVLRREQLPPPAGSRVYVLTDRGRELEPVILGLGRWGTSVPMPAGRVFGVDSAVIALKTLFDPGRAAGIDKQYELRFSEAVFAVRVRRRKLEIRRAAAATPDAVIETDPLTLAGVLWHDVSPTEAIKRSKLAISGDEAAALEFLGLFPQ